MNIFELPFDILKLIIEYLTLNEVLTLGETCKSGDRLKYEKRNLTRLTIKHQNMMKFYQVQKGLKKLRIQNCLNVDWYLLPTLPRTVEFENCTIYDDKNPKQYRGVKNVIVRNSYGFYRCIFKEETMGKPHIQQARIVFPDIRRFIAENVNAFSII